MRRPCNIYHEWSQTALDLLLCNDLGVLCPSSVQRWVFSKSLWTAPNADKEQRVRNCHCCSKLWTCWHHSWACCSLMLFSVGWSSVDISVTLFSLLFSAWQEFLWSRSAVRPAAAVLVICEAIDSACQFTEWIRQKWMHQKVCSSTAGFSLLYFWPRWFSLSCNDIHWKAVGYGQGSRGSSHISLCVSLGIMSFPTSQQHER